MKKKWFATIRANGSENGRNIKLGIIETNGAYAIINNDNDHTHTVSKTLPDAIRAIADMWGTWTTFTWRE